ncbi:hypothetical protein GCK72_017219 [Caenorhabditis remanei]|uniref:Secreted protein n=1 Tax=Caenorhabditis remanei TaxID=31234 RepID=A0A6A5G6I0_CAERE|nr:hypothetical protein GCK72_017219 [Caenorhabditis remanei]KAF1750668.1 hypothetical protein GCK72_017219 [Caenorhabditis remanei]
MQSSILLLFLLLILLGYDGEASSSPRTMKLCLYLKAIRRSTAECDKVTLDNVEVSRRALPTSKCHTFARHRRPCHEPRKPVRQTRTVCSQTFKSVAMPDADLMFVLWPLEISHGMVKGK